MPNRRFRLASALTLSLLLQAGSALAQTSLPGAPPAAGGLFGLTVGSWYVESHLVSAGTFIDGVDSDHSASHIAPTLLAVDVADHQSLGSKSAAAAARVGATSLGTSAAAGDALHPDGTWTAAASYASVMYWAVLDGNAPLTFNLKLDGHLGVTGSRALGDDRSGAALAVFAQGSQRNFTTESQRALFSGAGIDIDAEGDALLTQFKAWPTTTQPQLATFGAQASVATPGVDVDTSLHVTAEGTRIDCDPGVSPVCGRYFYFLNVFMFTGAQNGGFADFSHTLQVDSFSLGGGAAQPFLPQSPVPEPASTALMLLGGAALAALRRRRG